MSKVYRHPITGYVYSVNEVGLVRIDDPATGCHGIYDDRGNWFEGEIRDIDMQAVGWVGRTPEARSLRESAS